MKLFARIAGIVAFLLCSIEPVSAASAYGGFYVGTIYISFSGSINVPEYSAGAVAITVDLDGRLTSNNDLSGTVDASGVVTFNPNASGFTTGSISGRGTLSATTSRTANGVTTTLRLSAPKQAPGYGDGGNLAGRITQHNPTRSIRDMSGVAFNGSQFVAVGDRGSIAYSDDGINWTRFGLPTTFHLRSVAVRTEPTPAYVAVGEDGALFYSTDGKNWSSRASSVFTYRSVAYGNGTFVAVDIFGTVKISPTGDVWGAGGATGVGGGATGYPTLWFLNGQFVMANNTSVSFSPDGVTWTPGINLGISTFNGGPKSAQIAYGNGIWVAGGDNGFATSANGEQWTKVATPNVTIDQLAFGGGVFVAHDGGDELWASTDGLTWKKVGKTPDLRSVTYAKGRFVAVGSELWTSTDGYTWINPELDLMRTEPPYVGRGTRPQDGPPGFAPVLGSVGAGNLGKWWYGENGYLWYYDLPAPAPYGEVKVTDSTIRAFAGDPAYFGIFAGDQGTMIHVRDVGGFEAQAITVLRPVTAENLLKGIMVGNQKAVFIGTGGVIVRSADNTVTNFVVAATGTTATLRDIAYYDTNYGIQTPTNTVIVIGDNGTVLTSPDGNAWVKRDVGTTENIVGVSFIPPNGNALGRIVVQTESGLVFQTRDLANWTAIAPMPNPHRFTGFGQGEYALRTSPLVEGEHVAWRMFYDQALLARRIEHLTFGNGIWVGTGQDFSAVSIDSFDWKWRPTIGGLRSVAFGNGKFVALGSSVLSGGISGISYDGLNWELRTNLPPSLSGIAFGGGRFAAVGPAGKIAISDDGITWTDKSLNIPEGFHSVIYANGKFVALGTNSEVAVSENNGDTWQFGAAFISQTYGVAGGNGVFVMGGQNGMVATSTNGRNWTSKKMPYRGPINSYPTFKKAAYANGTYYLFAALGEIFTSTNGTDWVENHSGVEFTHVDGVKVANGRVLIAGTQIHSLAIETAGAPAITAHPQAVSVATGGNASFNATANGAGNLTYQWFRNGVPLQDGALIGGATSPNLTIQTVGPHHAGEYHVAVLNDAGGTVSLKANLTVEAAPMIVTQPAPVTLVQGGKAVFWIKANGPGPFTYEWRKGGVPLSDGGKISGATTALLTIENAQSAEAGDYDVVVSNQFGSSTSSAAALTVEETPTAPIITAQPQAITVNVGETIRLSFSVKGAKPLTIIWFRDEQVFNDARVTGLGTSSIEIRDAKGTDSGIYYANIGNNLGFAQTLKVRVAVLGDVGFRQDFTINTQGNVNEIIHLSDNEFILAGSPTVRDGAYVLQRIVKIDGKGAPITTFGGTRPTDEITTIAPVADGKYVVGGGFSRWGTDTTIQKIARINSDGTLDTSFTSTAAPAGVGFSVVKVISLPGGKLLVARSGSSSQNSLVTRYNEDGTADANFTDVDTFRTTIAGMAVQADGTIWVGGSFGLKKIGPNGGDAPVVVQNAAGEVWVGPDNKVYFAHGAALKRLNVDGTPDNAFVVTLNSGAKVAALASLADGRLIIGGDFRTVNNTSNSKMAIIAAANGAVDASFASPYNSDLGTIQTIIPLGDGSVLAGGSASYGTTQMYVQRVQIERQQTGGGGQTFEQWSAGKGFIPDVNDGPQDDADNDGLPNSVEFALGTNPTGGGANEKPKDQKVQAGAETYAGIQFTRNKNAEGVTIQVTASNSVVANSNETITESVEDLGNGIERVVVRSTRPLSQVFQLFFHVKVAAD